MNYPLLLVIILFSIIRIAQAADIAMTSTQQQNLGISVASINKNTMITSRRLSAEIVVPIGQERVVSAAQSGLIDHLFVASGQQVKKGQPIAHLISADLISLQKDYLQALIQSKLAAKSFVRDAELFRDGIIPERRYLETESAREEINASLSQRKQSLRLAGMSDSHISKLNSASGMNSGITLVAPIDGQVLEQMVSIGQRIDMGMPIYRISRLDPLWLEIHAPLEYFPLVKVGMSVQVPKFQASGTLIAIIRNVNKADQTLHLRAEITKNTNMLSPGQFVEAVVNLGDKAQYLSVPKSALVKQGNEVLLFTQIKNGFHPVKVKLISEQGDEAVIDSSLTGNILTGGEKVAVSGLSAIKGIWIGLGAK